MKVFPSLFSKSDRPSNARSVGRSSQRAKSSTRAFLFAKLFLLRFFCQKKKRMLRMKRLVEKEKPHFIYRNCLPAFFFDTRGTNENFFASLRRGRKRLSRLSKKEMPYTPQAKSGAPLLRCALRFAFAEGDKGSAPLTAPPFEKVGRKLSKGFATKSTINSNLLNPACKNVLLYIKMRR